MNGKEVKTKQKMSLAELKWKIRKLHWKIAKLKYGIREGGKVK